MTVHDIDLAVARLNRRLDKIMACTSGMPNYEEVNRRVQIWREVIAEAAARKEPRCPYCGLYARIPSSVSDKWVHPDSPIGRVICPNP